MNSQRFIRHLVGTLGRRQPFSVSDLKDSTLGYGAGAALRDFDPAHVGFGSLARITAPQQQWPVHLNEQTCQPNFSGAVERQGF